jgi:hypothetical protein
MVAGGVRPRGRKPERGAGEGPNPARIPNEFGSGPYLVRMQTVRFEMRVSEGWLGRVDAARGEESRASFVRRAVAEKAGRPLRTDAEVIAQERAFRDIDGHRTTTPVVLPSGRTVVVEPSEGSGCPECGGLWERRPGESGRFCVDCGGREAS